MTVTPQQRAAYDTARRQVLATCARLDEAREHAGGDRDAPVVKAAVADYVNAHTALLAATVPIKAEVNAAWDTNQLTVQEAAAAIASAVVERTRVEGEIAESARARNPARPVLSVDELARAQEAYNAWQTARDGLVAAKAAFKAGVTVDQLDKMT